jgi:hypothetical protein
MTNDTTEDYVFLALTRRQAYAVAVLIGANVHAPDPNAGCSPECDLADVLSALEFGAGIEWYGSPTEKLIDGEKTGDGVLFFGSYPDDFDPDAHLDAKVQAVLDELVSQGLVETSSDGEGYRLTPAGDVAAEGLIAGMFGTTEAPAAA